MLKCENRWQNNRKERDESSFLLYGSSWLQQRPESECVVKSTTTKKGLHKYEHLELSGKYGHLL